MKKLELLFKEWLKEMCVEMVRNCWLNLFLIYTIVSKIFTNMILKICFCISNTISLLCIWILECT